MSEISGASWLGDHTCRCLNASKLLTGAQISIGVAILIDLFDGCLSGTGFIHRRSLGLALTTNYTSEWQSVRVARNSTFNFANGVTSQSRQSSTNCQRLSICSASRSQSSTRVACKIKHKVWRYRRVLGLSAYICSTPFETPYQSSCRFGAETQILRTFDARDNFCSDWVAPRMPWTRTHTL